MNLKATLLLFLLVGVKSALAQYANVRLYQQAEDQIFVGAPTNAVNSRDPANIVAAATSEHIYYTQDGGKTWHSKELLPGRGADRAPVIITGPKGSFFYVHTSNPTAGSGGSEAETSGRMVIQKSDDGGVTWSEGESVAADQRRDQHNAWATTDHRGNLYVTWAQYGRPGDANNACTANILFSMSKNAKKWTDPVVISNVNFDCSKAQTGREAAMPVVTPEGKVMIAWSNAGKVYLDRSFNGGEVWLRNDIEVADLPGGSSFAIPGHGTCNSMPVLLTDNSKSRFRGSLYLVWADQRNGANDTDIWFTRSHNFGDNWSSPMRINDDNKGKHQYMPWMAVDEATGYLYVVYFDRRNHNGLETDVYLAYSTDGGASFKNMLISETPFTPREDDGISYATHIAVNSGVIAPIWTREEDGKASLWTAIIAHDQLVKPEKK